MKSLRESLFDSDRPGYGTHIWTLLTDLTMKDIKQS